MTHLNCCAPCCLTMAAAPHCVYPHLDSVVASDIHLGIQVGIIGHVSDLLLGLADSVVEVTGHSSGCMVGVRAGRQEKGWQSVEMEADEQ